MKKLSFLFGVLFCLTAQAEEIRLFEDYRIGQKIERFSVDHGYSRCQNERWACRQKAGIEFAGMTDWQQYFYFQKDGLIKISLVRPLREEAFYKVSGALLNAGFSPLLLGNGRSFVYDVIQNGKGKTTLRVGMDFAEVESQLHKGKKVQYVFVSELTSPDAYRNARDYERNHPNPALREAIFTLNLQEQKMTVSFVIPSVPML